MNVQGVSNAVHSTPPAQAPAVQKSAPPAAQTQDNAAAVPQHASTTVYNAKAQTQQVGASAIFSATG